MRILLKTLLILGLLGSLNPALASSTTDFGFVLNQRLQKDLDPITIKQVKHYFKNIELGIKTGIRFGVDRLIEINFEIFPEEFESIDQLLSLSENFPCRYQSNHYLSITGENQITINKKYLPLILLRTTRFKDQNGCSHRENLIKALELKLLTLPGSDDMDRRWTNEERDTIQFCRNKDSRKILTSMRQNPRMKEKCKAIQKLISKRERFEAYQNQIQRVLYNTKMEFDLTSLTEENLSRFDICKRDYKETTRTKSGKKLKMLGMAIVYMAPGHQTSVAGHVAERYIFCQGEKLKDIMFEYTQMTEGELDGLRHHYKKYDVSDEYLKRQHKTILIKSKHNPATQTIEGYGFYNFQKNRDILEVWPKVSEQEIYEGLQTSIKELKEQENRYKNEIDFEAYDLLNNNCTHPIRERLNKFGGEYKISDFQGFHPTFIFNFLRKKTADKIIIYPSQRTMRKLNMLQEGESIFWENITLWSKASDREEKNGFMLLYPETHGFLKSLIVMPTHGAINLAASVVETLVGILVAPLKWLSKVPGFKWLAPSKKMESHLAKGLNGITLSLSEMFGLRLRYPKPTAWSEEEQKLIYEELPYRDPKILDYLLDRVYQ